MALVSHLPDENCRDTVVQIGFYEMEDAFKEINEKLEDGAYRKLQETLMWGINYKNPFV